MVQIPEGAKLIKSRYVAAAAAVQAAIVEDNQKYQLLLRKQLLCIVSCVQIVK